MDLPFVDDFTVLQIHLVQRVGIICILKNHILILSMEHDLLGAEKVALRSLDL